MKRLFYDNRYFFIPYLLFVILCTILLILFTKTDLHILSNEANSPFFDIFFKYATYFGDGAVIALLSLILLFVKFRYALIFLTGSLATALIVNLFKKVVFHEMYRPSKYFELYESYKLHLVEGVKLHSLQSFPSGHTATAFNLFLMIALMVKNNFLKFIFFILAALVAYSRVYISQHFLVDITAGSIIGVMLIVLTWLWFEKFDKQWLNRSFIRRSGD
ncbi:phosphatase PAP2 family protein [Maribellus comscasis]|uniref:Phosphatase PAP2 family protein n=1 Tax=Maribellus comscasis TaxID=2681766 RepID=A0A6I6K614_9BACT|nr:phosphatase PAP2 family protein [Maribellus comscasis]QGY47073.1 phosphatase PAP2 family protein [Maribellus comscasis]